MAKIEWIETRLLNWARWRLTRGSGVLGYAGVNLEKALTGVREPYADIPVPTNAIEAGETDDAIGRLPSALKVTIESHYIGRGTLEQRLRRLCCSKSTYYARIDQAHRVLAEHFAARQDKRQAERSRVERINAMARP